MHIKVTVSDEMGFEAEANTTITIHLDGFIHADFINDSEVIMGFGNAEETQYFTSIVDLVQSEPD